MEPHEMMPPNTDPAINQRRLRWGLAFFLAIALFFLWEEHRAHLLGALPWLLLLACPLMHRFMHGGHGSHGRGHAAGTNDQEDAGKKRHDEHAGHGCC